MVPWHTLIDGGKTAHDPLVDMFVHKRLFIINFVLNVVKSLRDEDMYAPMLPRYHVMIVVRGSSMKAMGVSLKEEEYGCSCLLTQMVLEQFQIIDVATIVVFIDESVLSRMVL